MSINPNSISDRGIFKDRIANVVGPHSNSVFLRFIDSESVHIDGFYGMGFIKKVLGAEALDKLGEAFRKGQ